MRLLRNRWSLKETLDRLVSLLALGTPLILVALAWSRPASQLSAPSADNAAAPTVDACRGHFRLVRPGVVVWHGHNHRNAAGVVVSATE